MPASKAPQSYETSSVSLGLLNQFKRLFENQVFTSVREGLTYSLPVIVAGTMAGLLNSFPLPAYQRTMLEFFGPEWKSFGIYIWNGTLSAMSIIMVISISNSQTENYNSRNPARRINSSIISLVAVSCLLCTIEPGQLFVAGAPADKMPAGVPSIWLGVNGLLWATMVALASSYLLQGLLKFKKLRMIFYSASSDTTIAQSMSALIPAVLTILVFALLKMLLKVFFGIEDINGAIYKLVYMPFESMGKNTLETAGIYGMARHFLWFLGIHGSNVLEPIMTQIYVPALEANQNLVAAGQPPSNVFTKPFFDCYTSIGGSGSTMGLLIACLWKQRDRSSRKIVKISIVPAIFNMNEILLFGLPVVMNPVFLVPFMLVPLILTTLAYLANIFGLVPYTVHQVDWNIPILISGYATTGSAAGAILQLVCLAVSTLIYLPFVSLDNWLKAEQFEMNFKKLIQVTTNAEAASAGPRFLGNPDRVGSLARGLAHELEHGLGNDEVFMVYQPQVNSNTGRVYGIEALMRWRHPQIGLVPPPVFIGLAEDSGFIRPLGLWSLDQACRQIVAWRRQPGTGDLVMSVNVSAKQLEDRELPDKVLAMVNKYNLPCDSLKLEITESIALSGNENRKVLHRFSEMGFKLAIDDFGMGHTSLNYLKECRVDSLKLDSILSRDVLVSRNSCEIISSIAELCRSLKIDLVAEFVEDEAHLVKLRELGCHNIQGYYYSRPLSPEQCLDFISSQHFAFG